MTTDSLRIFSDATAIVTGGASGIGRGLVEELAKRGCDVVVADRQIELADEVASGIRALGGKSLAVKLDVRDYGAVKSVVDDAFQRTGRLDYLFNNAGVNISGDVLRHDVSDWDHIIDTNLRGVVNGIQAAYRSMCKQGYGHIVNTASLAGLIPNPGNASYATTKHAVVGLSTSLRAEAEAHGLRVTVLCPGYVRTAILNDGGKFGKDLSKMPTSKGDKISSFIESFNPVDPSLFARNALNKIAKNRSIVILPSWYRIFWIVNRVSPSLGMLLSKYTYAHRKRSVGV